LLVVVVAVLLLLERDERQQVLRLLSALVAGDRLVSLQQQ
jgi:hypothetical protein